MEAKVNTITEWVESSLEKVIESAAIAPAAVLAEAEARGLLVEGENDGERIRSLGANDIARLDKMARSYVRSHTQMAGAQGFVTGLGGLITLPVTVPTDVAAFVILVVRVNSAVMQSYGFESQTEEGQAMLRLGLAAGLGINKLTVMGTTVLVESLTKQVMTKPYREAVVMGTVRAVAKRVGINLYKRHFAKVVPVLGGGINAGVSAGLVYSFARRATTHYRGLALEHAFGGTPVQLAAT